MTLKSFYIALFTVILVMTSVNTNPIKTSNYALITTSKTHTAGETLVLEFTHKGNTDALLYCANSYGSVMLNPIVTSTLKFEIPKTISNKSGILNWQLISASNTLSGKITVLPKAKVTSIETYIGPPNIEAGNTDYTMLVTIPTDALDNPLADSTKVTVKHQFLSLEKQDDIYTKHGFGYKNLYAYNSSGRMLINTECLGLNSKEYTINITPAIPTNFSITAKRVHDYADGNQITTLTTSIIRDRYNNIVSDGTFVTFFITNTSGHKTKTSGTTINGIANAKLLHPDHEENLNIKAYIEGMANSNRITLDYKQAVLDFNTSYSKDNRTITVGPLQSFMNQRIPDGCMVYLKIFKDQTLLNEIITQSIDGFVTFKLNEDRYPKGLYNFTIETSGITKSYPNKNL